MKALIFAAGLGTRLKPLTDTMPKALVPVGGKPLLLRVVEKLKEAGIDDFVINVHHFADMIEEYVRDNGSFGCKVAFSDERDLLRDTGGGILHAGNLLLDGCRHDDFFLVHNVDIISDLDIRWFCSRARQDALAVLLVSERETSRYLLFNDDMRLVGWTDVRTGEVKSPYTGLDISRCRRYAFSGIHLVSNHIFAAMTDGTVHPLSSRQDTFGDCFSIIDFYLAAAASYHIRGIVAPHLTLTDVGKPESLAAAGSID